MLDRIGQIFRFQLHQCHLYLNLSSQRLDSHSRAARFEIRVRPMLSALQHLLLSRIFCIRIHFCGPGALDAFSTRPISRLPDRDHNRRLILRSNRLEEDRVRLETSSLWRDIHLVSVHATTFLYIIVERL